jgi:RNA polymerase sigma factor (TIGR02999 family)
MMGIHSSQPGVTQLLVELREGKDEVFGDLFEEVYTELRQQARGQRRRWKGDPSLHTTALAHEAYLKLVDQEEQSWESRSHFFAVAAKAMRHILINKAKRNRAEKRGGDAPVLSLDELRASLDRSAVSAEERAEALVALDEALAQFEAQHPRAARAVECRFFGGMTIDEAAEALGVSNSTVSRDWKLAQAWLYRAMKRMMEGAAPEDEKES